MNVSLLEVIFLLGAVGCGSVVIVDPSDDSGGSSLVEPPSQGGFSSGGSSASGGSPSAGAGEGAGGSTSTGGPTNPDPTCVPNLELPAGDPIVLGTGVVSPRHLVLAGDYVYVTESTQGEDSGSLARVPRTGGELERVVTGLKHPWRMAASEDNVYWLDYDIYGSARRFSIIDGSTSVVQSLLLWPYDMKLYDGQLYVTEESGIRILATRSIGTLETIPTRDYPGLIALDETGIYASVVDSGGWLPDAIVHIDRDGNMNELYSGDAVRSARAMMLDGNYLYVLGNRGGTGLVRGTRDGGPLVTLASTSGSLNAVIADCFIYFTSVKEGLIQRVPLQGGDIQTVATGQYGVMGIAVDDEAIWWVTQYSPTVVRLDK